MCRGPCGGEGSGPRVTSGLPTPWPPHPAPRHVSLRRPSSGCGAAPPGARRARAVCPLQPHQRRARGSASEPKAPQLQPPHSHQAPGRCLGQEGPLRPLPLGPAGGSPEPLAGHRHPARGCLALTIRTRIPGMTTALVTHTQIPRDGTDPQPSARRGRLHPEGGLPFLLAMVPKMLPPVGALWNPGALAGGLGDMTAASPGHSHITLEAC